MSWNAPTNAFDMGDMMQAVNGAADIDGNAQHDAGHDESGAGQESQRVGGWVARTPLNYEALGADRDTAHTYEESGAIPVWAHNAAKYEWVDEYGDGQSALCSRFDDAADTISPQLALACPNWRKNCSTLEKHTSLKQVLTLARTMRFLSRLKVARRSGRSKHSPTLVFTQRCSKT